MDAINALVAASARHRATVDEATVQLAGVALPRPSNPDPTAPAAPDPSSPGQAGDVDVAEQLTTMMVAADMHHATTAALRSALATYQASVEMLRR